MTKLDKYSKAHKLAIKTGDFSLLDEIYHPEFSIYDPKTGFTNNYDYWKVMLRTFTGIFMDPDILFTRVMILSVFKC